MTSDKLIPDPWPALSYSDFAETRHLLHMIVQIVGKLKLNEPFQAQWAGVPLWVNARGLTTGAISYPGGAYEVRFDFIAHQVEWYTSTGASGQMALGPGSVADFAESFLGQLRQIGIAADIDMMPQEVPDPIPFDQDSAKRPYDRDQINAWWRILLSIRRVFYAFQGRFTGKTQPIGLMWGTLDIRHVVYNGHPETPSPKDGYIDRNAMTEGMIEMGWWTGDASHPEPAFFAFTFPHPKGIETAKIAPDGAGWVTAMGEFILDYEALRQSKDPDAALTAFLESTYQAGAKAAGWDPALLGSGKPN